MSLEAKGGATEVRGSSVGGARPGTSASCAGIPSAGMDGRLKQVQRPPYDPGRGLGLDGQHERVQRPTGNPAPPGLGHRSDPVQRPPRGGGGGLGRLTSTDPEASIRPQIRGRLREPAPTGPEAARRHLRRRRGLQTQTGPEAALRPRLARAWALTQPSPEAAEGGGGSAAGRLTPSGPKALGRRVGVDGRIQRVQRPPGGVSAAGVDH